VANILEHLPEATPVTVVAEVGSRDDQQELPTRPTVEVHWLHRDGIEAGTSRLLLAHVRDLPLPGAHPYVWGGGESRAMTAVRRHVRATLGLPREQVSLVAYWRHPTGPAAGRA
jgi:NADPH-dependent ferric siderophore reductase